MEKYTVYIFKNANSCIRYIGITKQKIKNRISAHERDAFDTKRADYNCPRNCWIRKIINSIGYIPYEVIKTNLSEEVAFTLEKILIDFYGRKDLGEGPLMNADEGGTGGNRIKTPGQWNFVIASRKPVNQYDFDGNLVNSWSYILEAERETKIPNNKIISCCKGRRNSAGGFIWRYSNDNFNKFRVKNTTIRAIDVYSLHGEYLTTFKTSGEMGRIFEISDGNIITACNGGQLVVAGYIVRWHGEPFNKYPIHRRYERGIKYIKKFSEDIVRTLGKPRIIGE